MMCHRIGRSPISTMGLGLEAVSSDRRVPSPPARITTFTTLPLPEMTNRGRWLQCKRLFTDGGRRSACPGSAPSSDYDIEGGFWRPFCRSKRGPPHCHPGPSCADRRSLDSTKPIPPSLDPTVLRKPATPTSDSARSSSLCWPHATKTWTIDRTRHCRQQDRGGRGQRGRRRGNRGGGPADRGQVRRHRRGQRDADRHALRLPFPVPLPVRLPDAPPAAP